jgi:hypothetical protein
MLPAAAALLLLSCCCCFAAAAYIAGISVNVNCYRLFVNELPISPEMSI